MLKLHRLAALTAASIALCTTPALAAPITLKIRVEGPNSTLYEGPLTTDVHQIDGGDGNGPQNCDGVHNGAPGSENPYSYPSPVPTATSALDDAARQHNFTWGGNWYPSFGDFLVNQVGPDAPASGTYYTYLINWKTDANYGGCQHQVSAGDDLVWAPWDYAGPFLQLSGTPASVETGKSFTVTVNGQDGSGNAAPASGATVDGQTTDGNGHATLSFPSTGVYTLKATKPGAVRSNGQTVCVYAPGTGDCGTAAPAGTSTDQTQQPASQDPGTPAADQPVSTPAAKDTTPPVVRITSVAPGKRYARGPRTLTGDVDDSGGIDQVFLRLRATDGGGMTASSRCRWFSGKRGVFTRRAVPCSNARFFRIGANARFSYLLPARLRQGQYVLEVKVLDKAFNVGRSSAAFGVK